MQLPREDWEGFTGMAAMFPSSHQSRTLRHCLGVLPTSVDVQCIANVANAHQTLTLYFKPPNISVHDIIANLARQASRYLIHHAIIEKVSSRALHSKPLKAYLLLSANQLRAPNVKDQFAIVSRR